MEQLPLSCIGKHRWYLYRKHRCGRRTENLYLRRKREAASSLEVPAGRSADLSQMAVRHRSGRVYLLAAQHSAGRSGECTDTSAEECPILYPLGFAGQQPSDAYVGERIGERQKGFHGSRADGWPASQYLCHYGTRCLAGRHDTRLAEELRRCADYGSC